VLSGLVAVGGASAKSEIKVQVKGISNANLILGYRIEDKYYVVDTAPADRNGNAVFATPKPWRRGIYFVALPNRKTFDFMMPSNQTFTITTDTVDLYQHLQFKNSLENEQLAEYQRFIQEQRTVTEQIIEQKKQNPQNDSYYNEQLNRTDAKVLQYIEQAIARNKDNFLGDVLTVLRPINAQQAMPSVDTSHPDYEQIWLNYYATLRSNYFNNVNFNETGLIYTPFFKPYIDYFFKSLIIQHPDTINKYLDLVVEKAKNNSEMYQYIVEMFFLRYQQSEVMSHDAVVVHIADKYYLNGAATWGDSAYLKRIKDRVEELRPTLIGNIAPSLFLQSIGGDFVSLDTIKARYTIMCFYEPSCGHCRKEVPKLWNYYQTVRDKDVKVFAVYTQYDRAEWEKFVRTDNQFDWINVWDGFEGKNDDSTATVFSIGSNFRTLYDVNSTPLILLLDENKRILAKRMSIETLEKIIAEELKFNNK
jgi:thiol-disulfide isomerase/thioredoxin